MGAFFDVGVACCYTHEALECCIFTGVWELHALFSKVVDKPLIRESIHVHRVAGFVYTVFKNSFTKKAPPFSWSQASPEGAVGASSHDPRGCHGEGEYMLCSGRVWFWRTSFLMSAERYHNYHCYRSLMGRFGTIEPFDGTISCWVLAVDKLMQLYASIGVNQGWSLPSILFCFADGVIFPMSRYFKGVVVYLGGDQKSQFAWEYVNWNLRVGGLSP